MRRRLRKIWVKILWHRWGWCSHWFHKTEEEEGCDGCPIQVLNGLMRRGDKCVKLTLQKRVWWRFTWWIEGLLHIR